MRVLRVVLMTSLLASSGWGQSVPHPVLTPIQAELLADLQARNLAPGAALYAKVQADWTGFGCVLPHGVVIEAHVVSVVKHSKSSKASQVTLSFDKAQCNKSDLKPFAMTLAAIAFPQEDDSSVTMDMPRSLGSSAPSQGPPSGFRSMTSTNADIWDNMQHWVPVGQMPRVGGVYGIKGVKLSVGTGPQNSSVLSSADRGVALDKHTVLFLLPQSAFTSTSNTDSATARQPASASSSDAVPVSGNTRNAAHNAAAATPDQASTPEEEDADACAPPECNIDSPVNEAENVSGAAAVISILNLGYNSRLQREMAALNHDETLTYIDPSELLVTFNPHPLVPRHGFTSPGSTVRVIRAAVVDLDTKRVTRIVDWNLPDAKQYLWQLANHRVLVHVGNELRVYGPGLKTEMALLLDGPLAFVRTDPAGKTIAFGVVHERHTPELHAKLQEGQEQEPEEDVQIHVLNQSFETVATATSNSSKIPPTLLDEGEVKLLLQRDKRIHMVIHTWDNQWRSLARFNSSCTPQLSSVAPDLLLVITCNAMTGGREYRVMRPDGRLILRGESSLAELGHTATGTQDASEFALRILSSDQPLLPGTVFRLADLESAQVGVYRAEDGKRLFTVRFSDPSASDGGYALAPDGKQMAVLARDRIEVYALPKKRN
jgi:hypothetical protein